MSDSLTDRLEKQKSAAEAKRQAFVKAMQDRAKKIDDDNFARRPARVGEFLMRLRKEIALKIGRDEDLTPFEVPAEFDGMKMAERDIRLPTDTAHQLWVDFVKWGTDNGLLIEVTPTDGTPARITVSVPLA